MNSFVTDAAQNIINGAAGADRPTARKLAELSVGSQIHDLLYWANRIRLARIGPEIRLCAIIAGKTGRCCEDCAFCGQSARHPSSSCAEPERASHQQIVSAAQNAQKLGATDFGIVNSGRGPTDQELDELAPILRQLAEQESPCLCASLGILSDSQAEYLFKLGVRRYNHNLETSRHFFPTVVTTHTYDDRLATVAAVKRSGMRLCCGGIFGLGETMDDRIDLALTLAEISPDEVPLNFLHALDNTPLDDAKPLMPLEILRIIAIFRFILPDTHIKVAGGRAHSLRDMQSWIFFAGASGCMIGNYLLTKGRSTDDDHRMFADLQLPLARDSVESAHEIKA